MPTTLHTHTNSTDSRMKAPQVISLTLLLAVAATAQDYRPGKCPDPAVQADFDSARYLGKWFGITKLPTTFQTGQCSNAFYTLQEPLVIGVKNTQLLNNGTVSSTTGTAKVKDPAEPAKLEVSFSEDRPPGPYWVLSTDYDGHSLVYGCTDYGVYIKEFAWILSRTPGLPQETVDQLQGTLASIGVNVDKMVPTNQDPVYCRPVNE